jgi:hypothetical protein
MSHDPSVFSRWSQRKRAVAAEAESDEVRALAHTDARTPAHTPAHTPARTGNHADQVKSDIKNASEDVELTEKKILEKLGLPEPETMTQGDDFAAFLKAGVPEAIRKRALRTLWRSNPVLANLDGLIDHGEDYTDAATVPETMNTLYQVGKGMLRTVVEATEAEAKAEAEADMQGGTVVAQVAPAAENCGVASDDLVAFAKDDALQNAPENAVESNIKKVEEPIELEEEMTYTPQRMAFRCD